MVGAIADWFAVTALFKHPLGVPVPHTALVPKRKEMLGRSLQEFVGENFLQEEILRDRVRMARISERVGAWLTKPEHSRRVVDEASSVLRVGLSRIRDEDMAVARRGGADPAPRRRADQPGRGQPARGDRQGRGAPRARRPRARGGPPLAGAQRGDVHRGRRGAGAVVVAAGDQRAGDPPAAHRGGCAGSRTSATTRSTTPARRSTACSPSSPTTCSTTRTPRSARSGSRTACSTHPQMVVTATSLWRAFRKALTRVAPGPRGPAATARGRPSSPRSARQLSGDAELRGRLDGYAADLVVSSVDRYGDELTAVITHTIDRWDGKEAARRSSCTSAGTCSSSGSTAPSSAGSSAS